VARDANRRVREAAEPVLVEGERITSQGMCWGAQMRPRVPLLFLGRRQYLMALTDRRVLVFERRRRGPRASELVIGKRYETFTLEKVKRRRLLMQVRLRAMNGNVMVFEFRPGQRELGGELIARLTPSAHTSSPSHLMSSLGSPAPEPTSTASTGLIKGGSAAAASTALATKPATESDDEGDGSSDDNDDHSQFWNQK
jgi:hypothetical protein